MHPRLNGIRLSFRRNCPPCCCSPADHRRLGELRHGAFDVRCPARPNAWAARRSGVLEGPSKQLLGDVSEAIYRFLQVNQFLALLVIAWYGSALIAEDKRLQANLLYFARPVTPLRYILGKLGTAAFWAH
ncbi:MAG: hypothetical protein R3E96_05155 [Planctomycetota bacterium]